MKIKSLQVNGFRSLVDFHIQFDQSLTVVVGENDSGKSSLIECLKVVTEDRVVTADDFTYGSQELIVKLEVDDFVYCREYEKDGVAVREKSFTAAATQDYVDRTLARISANEYDPTTEEGRADVTSLARLLGLVVRANSNPVILRDKLVDLLKAAGPLVIEKASFPRFNNIQLDGRQFENVSAFFKEVFLKDKQASLWGVEVSVGKTLEGYVREHLQDYSNMISQQIRDKGIIDKLKMFMSELTDIRVEPLFHARDLNLDAKVKFLEHGTEIPIDNKGDGTKRRITMALLEFKKEQKLVANDHETIYLLDEPDTHLHVRAQLELVKTVEGFAAKGDQVILTTHSPFILNAAKPEQVRWLIRKNSKTTARYLNDKPQAAGAVLRALGIENAHLFFCRKILLVEGETEESFVSAQYLKRTSRTMSSSLVKIINVRGMKNIPGFARAVLELHDPQRIYVLHDADASEDLQELLAELNLPQGHTFRIGAREFEDAFDSVLLHRCWVRYHEASGKQCPAGWTVQAIQQLKDACMQDGRKFSTELRSLNQGGRSMSKPAFGAALGEFTDHDELPEPLGALFGKLIDE